MLYGKANNKCMFGNHGAYKSGFRLEEAQLCFEKKIVLRRGNLYNEEQT